MLGRNFVSWFASLPLMGFLKLGERKELVPIDWDKELSKNENKFNSISIWEVSSYKPISSSSTACPLSRRRGFVDYVSALKWAKELSRKTNYMCLVCWDNPNKSLRISNVSDYFYGNKLKMPNEFSLEDLDEIKSIMIWVLGETTRYEYRLWPYITIKDRKVQKELKRLLR